MNSKRYCNELEKTVDHIPRKRLSLTHEYHQITKRKIGLYAKDFGGSDRAFFANHPAIGIRKERAQRAYFGGVGGGIKYGNY